jgi:hypothetical protein
MRSPKTRTLDFFTYLPLLYSMKAYLLVAAGLALASCATHKPLAQPPAPISQPTSGGRSEQPLDGTILARKPTLLDELLGRTPKLGSAQAIPVDIGNGPVPRKCKGCTFNLVTGNQTVAGKKAQVAAGDGATATVIEKKAGPAVVASDSSTLNAVLGGGNLAAVHGDGNTLPQTATTQEAPGVLATLAKPSGYVLAGLGTVLMVGGVIYLIVAYKRRQKLAA